MCGFNNRNTFTVAFKKFTGNTPSDYVKQYQLIQL
jgi:AraC-like DNA-binding protein